MNVVQPQLALVATGDVSFTFRDEAFQWMETGNSSKEGKKHVRAGRWEVGGWERGEEGCFQVRTVLRMKGAHS